MGREEQRGTDKRIYQKDNISEKEIRGEERSPEKRSVVRKIEEKMERMERNVQFLEKKVETFDEEEEDEASRKRVEEGVQKNYDDDDDDDDDEKAVTTEEGREKGKPKAPSPVPPAPPPPAAAAAAAAPPPSFQGSSSENKTKAAINPLHEKYHKMIRMGVPEQAVRNKMSLDGVDDRNVIF